MMQEAGKIAEIVFSYGSRRLELKEVIDANYSLGEVLGMVSLCRRALLALGYANADISMAYHKVADETGGRQQNLFPTAEA